MWWEAYRSAFLRGAILTVAYAIFLGAMPATHAASDTGTLDIGNAIACVMTSRPSEAITYGYISGGLGSYTPTALTGGRTLVDLYQVISVGMLLCGPPVTAYLVVSRFSANSSQSWLTSVVCDELTTYGSSATFSYLGGTAKWTWTTAMFPTSGDVNCTITHG